MTPDVFYARSGDVSIAYQVVGDAPADLVFVRGFAATFCRSGNSRSWSASSRGSRSSRA